MHVIHKRFWFFLITILEFHSCQLLGKSKYKSGFYFSIKINHIKLHVLEKINNVYLQNLTIVWWVPRWDKFISRKIKFRVRVFLRGTKEKTKMMLKYIPTTQIVNLNQTKIANLWSNNDLKGLLVILCKP